MSDYIGHIVWEPTGKDDKLKAHLFNLGRGYFFNCDSSATEQIIVKCDLVSLAWWFHYNVVYVLKAYLYDCEQYLKQHGAHGIISNVQHTTPIEIS